MLVSYRTVNLDIRFWIKAVITYKQCFWSVLDFSAACKYMLRCLKAWIRIWHNLFWHVFKTFSTRTNNVWKMLCIYWRDSYDAIFFFIHCFKSEWRQTKEFLIRLCIYWDSFVATFFKKNIVFLGNKMGNHCFKNWAEGANEMKEFLSRVNIITLYLEFNQMENILYTLALLFLWSCE